MADPTTTEATAVEPAPRPAPKGVRGALLRYRVMAWVVGAGLVVLIFVGVPLQLWGHNDLVVEIVGTAHGYLYMVYAVLVFDLSRRVGWSLRRTAGVVLAGTVPLLGFFVERWVSHRTDVRQ